MFGVVGIENQDPVITVDVTEPAKFVDRAIQFW